MIVTVSAETETWSTRTRDYNDSWDQGDTAGRVVNVWAAVSPDANPDGYWGDSCILDLEGVEAGTTLYAVVADYSSGCTFGRDGGHASVLDAFATVEEAQALVTAALGEDKDSRYNFMLNGKEYYKSWAGHFERLNSLDVWEIVVRSSAHDPFRENTSDNSSIKRGS